MTARVVQLGRDPQPPPSNLDAEAAVLSSILLSREALEEVRITLEPRHFYAEANRRVYEAALELAGQGRPVDTISVATFLRDRGRLDQIGGTPHLANLVNATPAVAHVEEYARSVREKWRLRCTIEAAERLAVELRAGRASPDDAIERIQQAVEPAPAKRDRLAEHWFEPTEEFLSDAPPAQRWLLKRLDGMRDVGVLPKGIAGLLTATGGVGKTYALIDLAIAVATGGFWLETFRVAEPGHVLLALGEEDLAEAQRRLWRVCNALELSRDERADLGKRLVLLPLRGEHIALSHQVDGGQVVPSEFAGRLHDRLTQDGREWSLVVFDPMSRWAGGNIEGDNEAATRFVQIVESFCRLPGEPAVLMAHHSSKTSAKDGNADARGVTGIRDGFRWQASMDEVDGGVRLTNRKSNYSARFDELFLTKSSEPGNEGTLRPAKVLRPASADDLRERVLETIRSCPGLKSERDIKARTKGNSSKLSGVIKDLLREGLVWKQDGTFRADGDSSGDSPKGDDES